MQSKLVEVDEQNQNGQKWTEMVDSPNGTKVAPKRIEMELTEGGKPQSNTDRNGQRAEVEKPKANKIERKTGQKRNYIHM